MQVDLASRPQDLGFLFAVTLVGSWTVLIANKAVEGKETDLTARRIVQLVLGVLLGLFAMFLAGWMLVEPSSPGRVLVELPWSHHRDGRPGWTRCLDTRPTSD